MQVYLEVLQSKTLQSSVIEKHMLMQNQCHKNLGEVFENLGAYEHAKHHYTQVNLSFMQTHFQALKLNSENSVAWTRLGFINYDFLDDLNLAKQCFIAATKTMPTLDRIGVKICNVLVKLAEIYYLEAEYRECERTVNAILSRQQQLDKKTQIFVFLMKYYFLSLQSDHELAQQYLQKARQIQADAKISDLDLFKRVKQRGLKTYVVYNSQTQQYQALEGSDHRKFVVLEVPQNEILDFPSFLNALLNSILIQSDLDSFKKSDFIYDCSQYIELLKKHKQNFRLQWGKQDQQNLYQTDYEMQNLQVVKVIPTSIIPEKKVEKPKTLRKKPDNIEQQIRLLNLNRIQPYRDYIYKSLNQTDDFNIFMSSNEIINFVKLIQRGIQQQTQITNDPEYQNKNNNESFNIHTPDIQELENFEILLNSKIHKQDCFYVVRNLIRYLCEQPGLLTYQNSILVLRMFLMRNDLETLQITNPKVIQTMFELVLFNKIVIKEIKSGPIMSLRTQIYEFCSKNYNSLIDKISCPKLRFRLNYALMFTAFEINNDMEQSVQFYDKLDFELMDQEGSFPLPWCGEKFQIDKDLVNTFGNQKIKEAQQINIQNQALRDMKLAESESTKTTYQRKICSKQTAIFYLEQFFLHLVNHLSMIQSQQDVGSVGVNFQLNDDKLKEMWDQLIFCLVRVMPNYDFFTTVNNLFCIISAFKSLAPKNSSGFSNYETVLLKKIDFDPLMQEISERLRKIIVESGIQQSEYYSYQKLVLQTLLNQQIKVEMIDKLQVHFLRLVTAEFFYFNIKIGGSAGNTSDPGQSILTQLLKCLFYLQLLKSITVQDKFQGVTLLMKQLDALAQEHQELLMRTYSRLFSISFPIFLRTLLNGLKDQDLQMLVEKSYKYLFNFQAPDSSQPDIIMDEMQIDEEITELSLFAGMQKAQADKPKYPLPTPQIVFTNMVVNNKKEFDFAIITDVIKFLDLQLDGHLLEPCKLTIKDVNNSIKLVETFAKLFQEEKFKHLTKRDEDYINYTQQLKQKCFKENPFLQIQKPKQFQKHNYQGLHSVIKFLLNFYGSIAIQVYPYNVDLIFKKRFQNIERLKDLKELRKISTLVNLDLQYTDDFAETILLKSILYLQYYIQAANSKLLLDYKNADTYTAERKCKDQAINSAIWALNESFMNNQIPQCLNALHQLLSIYYLRVLTKRDTSNSKFQNIQQICNYFALFCEILEWLITPQKNDPRAKQNYSQQDQQILAHNLIENLLKEFKSSYQNNTAKQCLISDIIKKTEILKELKDSLKANPFYKFIQKDLLNSDYPFIQVQMQHNYQQKNLVQEIQDCKRAFEIALVQQDIVLTLESLLNMIELQLNFAITWKNNRQMYVEYQSAFENQLRPFLCEAENYLEEYARKTKSPNEETDDKPEILFDTYSSHFIRQKLNLPQDQQIDSIISRLYKLADTVVALLNDSPSLANKWMTLRFRFLTQKILIQEIGTFDPQLKILSQSAESILQDLQNGEDELNQQIQQLGSQPEFCTQQLITALNTIQERNKKSLISMYFSCSLNLGLTQLRIDVKKQCLFLWEQTLDYEKILQLYRRQYDVYKRSVNQSSSAEKLKDNHDIFKDTKEIFIKTIHANVDKLLNDLIFVRRNLIEFEINKNKNYGQQQGYTEQRQIYQELRKRYEFNESSEYTQPILKDVFELFLDSHYSKQFLKKHNLINESQKKMIRQALLKVCALCGPDEVTGSGPKFLDLNKLLEDEYLTEALGVCIKWYASLLEKNTKKVKRDQEMAKKLYLTYDEIKNEISIASNPNLASNQDVLMQTPQKQISTVFKQEMSAQKVFLSHKKSNQN